MKIECISKNIVFTKNLRIVLKKSFPLLFQLHISSSDVIYLSGCAHYRLIIISNEQPTLTIRHTRLLKYIIDYLIVKNKQNNQTIDFSINQLFDFCLLFT